MWVETVSGIDESSTLRIAAGDREKLAENQMAAATSRGAGKFGERGSGESATRGCVDLRYAGRQLRAFPPGGGRKAFGDEVPKRGHFFGRGRQGKGEGRRMK